MVLPLEGPVGCGEKKKRVLKMVTLKVSLVWFSFFCFFVVFFPHVSAF